MGGSNHTGLVDSYSRLSSSLVGTAAVLFFTPVPHSRGADGTRSLSVLGPWRPFWTRPRRPQYFPYPYFRLSSAHPPSPPSAPRPGSLTSQVPAEMDSSAQDWLTLETYPGRPKSVSAGRDTVRVGPVRPVTGMFFAKHRRT
ncbi:hypothetical protein NDU88_009986 [Pleurodeles waltl]|uniref:Uncharacterized protein n=1 Tax=Pleurodeles waltl TaxID=8319 RepID=A0AAV7PWN4_PLEWA|nr:hypothetical protein NDU88_009986 [Pleurodeles waltl]